MHLQRNATQRNAYQNYILLLTNNFKFYILQILGHLNFLSVFFVLAKNQFASLNNNAAHAVCRWQAHCVNNSEIGMQGVKTPCYSDFAFSGALKNQFEIISRNENYAFNHNKNFCRNGNNQSLRGFSRSNLFSVDCHAWQYARFRALAMTNLQFATTKANMVYFLAMVMAEILFLIFGVILISAFYLIEKLIQKKF